MSDTKRVAVVTGAAGGIGGALTQGLLSHGISVVAVDRPEAPLDRLTEAARAAGCDSRLACLPVDLAAANAAEAIVAAGEARFGAVDILVSNAGIGQDLIRPDHWHDPLRFWQVSPQDWRRFVEINATAGFMLARAVVPAMMRRGWGRIVCVTTSLGSMLRAGFAPYGPSKACLEALTAVMAADLAGTGVTANVLVPGGATNTGMVSPESGFPRQSLLQPPIMVPPLLWLVSDAAAAVTGRRFLAVHWDTALPPQAAAEKAGAPVAWSGIATMPILPGSAA
jgi:NAD(P)-dependent dehydrogenase (short-subunit alcohol dehydrogenase family)